MKINWLNLIVVITFISIIAFPRVLPFPRAFLAPDEMKIGAWVSEMADALLTGNWGKTAIANNPYPAVTFAWLETIQVGVTKLVPGWSLNLSDAGENVLAALPRRRFILALFNSAVILAIFWLLQRFYNNFVAAAAAILMALDPFFLAESRTFRTEGLTTGLMMLSTLTLLYYLTKQRARWLVISGALTGLAMLTRISALFMLPYAGLVLVFWPVLTKRLRAGWLRQIVTPLALWSLLAGLTFVALWPALWSSPLNGPDKLYQAIAPVLADTGRVWEKGVFFRGAPVGRADPGPLFYLYALAYRTTPILWVGLGAAMAGGGIWLARLGARYRQQLRLIPETSPRSWPQRILATWPVESFTPRRFTTIFLAAYLFFYFVAINLSATKIDRYLVAMLPGLSIVAALGYDWLRNAVRLKQEIILAGVLAGSALFSLPYHPYYYTYWNPLLGGGRAAVKMLPAMGRQGVDVALDYLNALPHAANLRLANSGLDLDYVQECPPVFTGHCLGPDLFLSADYVLNSTYSNQNQALLSNIQTIIPDGRVAQKFTFDGVDYTWLYQLPEGLHYVGYWLDLQSGSFSGYRLSASQVAAGQTVDVTLFWQNGEKSGWRFDDSELYVKVFNEIGQVQQIVPARLEPEFAPYLSQPQEFLVFTAALDFPPDTPLGIYPLEAGLRLKDSGQETLHFPLMDTSVSSGINSAGSITVNRGAMAAPVEMLPIQHRLNQLGEMAELTLLGYSVVSPQSAPETPLINLYWQAKTRPTQNYQLSLELFDQNKQLIASWSKGVAPDIHPVSDWQPGEIVAIPFPLEVGHTLPETIDQATLSIISIDMPDAPVAIDLSDPLKAIMLIRPQPNSQHRLDNVTFGRQLDLLGYDLEGRYNAQGTGTLFVKLHWLNRQPAKPLEAQVEVLDIEGQGIARQLLLVPSPANALTWRSAASYELLLTTLPDSLAIKVKPVGHTQWLTVEGAATETIVIDHLLSKIGLPQN